MITRIFRVKIKQALIIEFEEKFSTISIAAVRNAKGCISEQIYKPSQWTPYEFAMISVWENQSALKEFVGDDWSKAFIPNGMEKYVEEYWVHHYESWQ